MKKILIDASAIMSVLLKEDSSSYILASVENSELYSTECLPFEICNCLSKLFKRGLISEEMGLKVFDQFTAIEYKVVEPDFSNVLTLSSEENHYAYDMFYLDAAQKLNAKLLTLDSGLKNIAKKRGVKCL